MFWGQQVVQPLLVMIAVLCIPIMLFAKPIMIMRARKEQIVRSFIIIEFLINCAFYLCSSINLFSPITARLLNLKMDLRLKLKMENLPLGQWPHMKNKKK